MWSEGDIKLPSELATAQLKKSPSQRQGRQGRVQEPKSVTKSGTPFTRGVGLSKLFYLSEHQLPQHKNGDTYIYLGHLQ